MTTNEHIKYQQRIDDLEGKLRTLVGYYYTTECPVGHECEYKIEPSNAECRQCWLKWGGIEDA